MEGVINSHADALKEAKAGKSGARETIYRVTLPNQLNAIVMADQKANIIIGINTIVISIIIATTGSETVIQKLQFITNLKLSVPFTILFITSVLSGIVAFFVVRPVIKPWHQDARKKLFFRNYYDITLENYLIEMEGVRDSAGLIYEHLDTDMYLMGQAVIRKLRLLRIGYLIFLTGLILTVLSYAMLHIMNW